ncbi:MAG: 50S ribosomal protein L29 [Acidobacteria bacterium]|nr:50S ribosomal protein L29 [Acidobacteriota bacterium]
MKVSKVRELDSSELRKQLKEGVEKMFRLRLQYQMGQTEALKNLRVMRRDRARMLGVLRERELAESK